MTDVERIKQFIIDNPKAGRRTVSQQFGISERVADALIKSVRGHQINSDAVKTEPIKASDKQIAIAYLKEQGLNPNTITELLSPPPPTINSYGSEYCQEFVFGIMSDAHMCDKACAISELHDFYDRCRKAGVEHVLNAGDTVAGIGVYRGQEFDLSHHGYVEQLTHIMEYYPKVKGITTHLIAGNHDMSFKVKSGADIMESFATKRTDIDYLGAYDANILLHGVKIGLHHGAGGNSYALSYKMQKYIEKIGANQKPQIYALGHYHAAMHMFYRNIHCFLPCCFQKPNDFSVRYGLPNMIGGYIVHVSVLNDEHRTIRSLKSELISYYD